MGTLVNGIKEIFATAKTNGSNVMLCGNDGTPDGHMTMDNLASVLGGLMYIGYREDANVIGSYFSTTGSMNNQHFPADGSYWTLISIGYTSIKLCFQIAFSPYGDYYYRCYWNGWKSWRALS